MNPAAVARFFHIICDAVFMSLLAAGHLEGGLLGPISNYFATVETNGRDMLHLHCLIWLRGVSHLATLRSQIQDNDEFRQTLLSFLEHVIKCSACQDPHPETLHHACPDANDSITISQFACQLRSDSEAVAQKVQMRLPSHNPTCYKYNTRDSKVCQFDFPRPILSRLQIDPNGTIKLRRDNVWVNPWNPAIASLIRSNHHINFIPSTTKALALIHYITNYATKGDSSQYQRVMAAAIVRKAFKDHDKDPTSTPGNYTPTLDKFALKAFN